MQILHFTHANSLLATAPASLFRPPTVKVVDELWSSTQASMRCHCRIFAGARSQSSDLKFPMWSKLSGAICRRIWSFPARSRRRLTVSQCDYLVDDGDTTKKHGSGHVRSATRRRDELRLASGGGRWLIKTLKRSCVKVDDFVNY